MIVDSLQRDLVRGGKLCAQVGKASPENRVVTAADIVVVTGVTQSVGASLKQRVCLLLRPVAGAVGVRACNQNADRNADVVKVAERKRVRLVHRKARRRGRIDPVGELVQQIRLALERLPPPRSKPCRKGASAVVETEVVGRSSCIVERRGSLGLAVHTCRGTEAQQERLGKFLRGDLHQSAREVAGIVGSEGLDSGKAADHARREHVERHYLLLRLRARQVHTVELCGAVTLGQAAHHHILVADDRHTGDALHGVACIGCGGTRYLLRGDRIGDRCRTLPLGERRVVGSTSRRCAHIDCRSLDRLSGERYILCCRRAGPHHHLLDGLRSIAYRCDYKADRAGGHVPYGEASRHVGHGTHLRGPLDPHRRADDGLAICRVDHPSGDRSSLLRREREWSAKGDQRYHCCCEERSGHCFGF